MAKLSTTEKTIDALSTFLDEEDMRAAVVGAVGRKVARGRLDAVTVAFTLAKAGLSEEDARSVLDEISRSSSTPSRRSSGTRRPTTRGVSATSQAKSWWAGLDKATQSAYRSEFGAAARGRASDELIQKAYDNYGS